MNPTQREELRALIEKAIKRSQRHLDELEEMSNPIAPDDAIGRVSRMDAINNKGVSDAALLNARKKLAALKHSLARVDNPGFGECSSCGKQIHPKRLVLLPESIECVSCASR